MEIGYLVDLSMSASLGRNLLQNIPCSDGILLCHPRGLVGSAHLVSRMDKTHEPCTQVQSGEASVVFPSVLRTEAGKSGDYAEVSTSNKENEEGSIKSE